MGNKITIIGAGQVGSAIAFALCLKSVASEIVMIDVKKERAMGEALDIRQGTPYLNPLNIHDGDYSDAKDSNVVIISSGVARKAGQSRLELAQTNVDITKTIIPEITKYAPDAIYVIVANPVDILTYQIATTSGLPVNHVIGTGTLLDSARLRTKIADLYGIGQPNLHAYVFGEHGDSSFIPWSLAKIASVPVDEYYKKITTKPNIDFNHEEIEDFVRKSGGIIIAAKGCTDYGIAASTAKLCGTLKYSIDAVTIASTLLTGEYGISGVCLSILTILGEHGVSGRLEAPLTDDEVAKLRHSADCLKEVIKQINFK